MCRFVSFSFSFHALFYHWHREVKHCGKFGELSAPMALAKAALPEGTIPINRWTFRNFFSNQTPFSGPFTFFAPTDEAFRWINPFFVKALKEDQNLLRSVLLQHIVANRTLFPPPFQDSVAKTLNGKTLILSVQRNGLFVNQSLVLKNDIAASNGIVHIIKRLLLPPDQDKIVYPNHRVSCLCLCGLVHPSQNPAITKENSSQFSGVPSIPASSWGASGPISAIAITKNYL